MPHSKCVYLVPIAYDFQIVYLNDVCMNNIKDFDVFVRSHLVMHNNYYDHSTVPLPAAAPPLITYKLNKKDMYTS